MKYENSENLNILIFKEACFLFLIALQCLDIYCLHHT